jgi:hypothetical protein
MAKPFYVNINLQNVAKVINSVDASAPGDLVNLGQVQALLQGLRWKEPVRAASLTNVALATDVDNGSSFGGVTLATGDRVLLAGQTTASENGIYTVNASGAPTRANDANAFGELNGAAVLVTEGTNADRAYTQNAELTSLSDNQTWVQFGGGQSYSADGQGIELSGTTFSIELDGSTLSKSASGIKVNVVGNVVGRQSWLGPASAGATIVQAHGYGHAQGQYTVHIASTMEDISAGVDITQDSTNVTVTFAASQADRSIYRIVGNG